MLVQTCSSLPATCCTAGERQSYNQFVRLNVPACHTDQPPKPGSTARHPFQLFSSRLLEKQRVRVASPRHESDQDTLHQSTNSWDEPPPSDAGQEASQEASGVDWAKIQSLAALTGASTLAAVVVLQLSGKTDVPKLAYKDVPESLQNALPEQLGGKQHKAPSQLSDVGSFVQKTKVSKHMCFASEAATVVVITLHVHYASDGLGSMCLLHEQYSLSQLHDVATICALFAWGISSTTELFSRIC